MGYTDNLRAEYLATRDNADDVQRCSPGTLPTCCEEHSVRFALLLRSVYAAEYAKFLLENEPPSGWADDQQSALAFAKERN